MEYRQHASMDVLPHSDYFKHVSAMTKEELHSKAEIAEELAVRDMRIKELEAKLAAMTQERDIAKHNEQCTHNANKLMASQLFAAQARILELENELKANS